MKSESYMELSVWSYPDCQFLAMTQNSFASIFPVSLLLHLGYLGHASPSLQHLACSSLLTPRWYKTTKNPITNQFEDSASATMIHRLFLGIHISISAKPNLKLPVKAKVKNFVNLNVSIWHFLVQLAWWLHIPPGPRSCLRGWRSRSRAPSSTQLPDFVSLSNSHGSKVNLIDTEEVIPGSPGEDYPIYSSPPETSFSCDGFSRGL